MRALYFKTKWYLCSFMWWKFFSIESNDTCGLYKDLFSDRIFKYYNKNKCYEKKPNNSIYLNEKEKIFKCNEGYNFENGEYIKI